MEHTDCPSLRYPGQKGEWGQQGIIRFRKATLAPGTFAFSYRLSKTFLHVSRTMKMFRPGNPTTVLPAVI